MPPKKRALAEVDSNAPIQESKTNKKSKMNKENNAPASTTESDKETKVDEVRTEAAKHFLN